MGGTFEGSQFIGTLENGRVALAYGATWADQIPDDLKAEIDAIALDIIAGNITATVPVEE